MWASSHWIKCVSCYPAIKPEPIIKSRCFCVCALISLLTLSLYYSSFSRETERILSAERERKQFVMRVWLTQYKGWEVPLPADCKLEAPVTGWCSSRPSSGVWNQGSQCISPGWVQRHWFSGQMIDVSAEAERMNLPFLRLSVSLSLSFFYIQALSRLNDAHPLGEADLLDFTYQFSASLFLKHPQTHTQKLYFTSRLGIP